MHHGADSKAALGVLHVTDATAKLEAGNLARGDKPDFRFEDIAAGELIDQAV
jgi:hypothetical protein